MRQLTILPIFMCSIAGIAYGESKAVGLEDINVDIVVSIVGMPETEQIFDKNNLFINYDADPLPVNADDRLELKVEIIDASGRKRDITNSEYINIHTTFYMFHECGKREICVWPRDDWKDDPPSVRYGQGGYISVEYITSDGQIGFNGIMLDVISPD